MDGIHGDMMLGTAGDYLIETAASLTILMMITGIYLWWAKQGRLKPMLVPKTGKGRSWWRDLHGAFGTWVSLILLLFCLSGMAWAGPATAVAQVPADTTTTVVRPGQSLWDIAEASGTADVPGMVARIAELNDLKGTTIRAGQTLEIPTA